MIKFTVVLLCALLICACEPVEQAHIKKNLDEPPSFICLSSQNECELSFVYGDFTLHFSGQVDHGRIKTELPFSIALSFVPSEASVQIKRISSYLEGVDMFMGKIPIFFEQKKTVENHWIAHSLLASCSEEIMTWRLWVQVEIVKNGQVEQQQFFIDFDSQRL
ncbi:hypothetical protein NBRC116592_33770 [Colwellia sp. KU-HH00111]|uniref:hypothetical protein n=1 Tax=Colwellia sp. KU-HH00111 TaxID=3127652 RepID=UPI003102BBDC